VRLARVEDGLTDEGHGRVVVDVDGQSRSPSRLVLVEPRHGLARIGGKPLLQGPRLEDDETDQAVDLLVLQPLRQHPAVPFRSEERRRGPTDGVGDGSHFGHDRPQVAAQVHPLPLDELEGQAALADERIQKAPGSIHHLALPELQAGLDEIDDGGVGWGIRPDVVEGISIGPRSGFVATAPPLAHEEHEARRLEPIELSESTPPADRAAEAVLEVFVFAACQSIGIQRPTIGPRHTPRRPKPLVPFLHRPPSMISLPPTRRSSRAPCPTPAPAHPRSRP
jgi:hypothetical protein